MVAYATRRPTLAKRVQLRQTGNHHQKPDTPMTVRRPNFLFFITDQQRADHLGCYGNALLRTPHIDAIALSGRRF